MRNTKLKEINTKLDVLLEKVERIEKIVCPDNKFEYLIEEDNKTNREQAQIEADNYYWRRRCRP